MVFPRAIEHSKNYIVNLQFFGDRFSENDPTNLNYLTTSFEINHSGGSSFIHQKGRPIATAIATQPTNSITVNCVMSDADFSIVMSTVITQQHQILMSIGKLTYDKDSDESLANQSRIIGVTRNGETDPNFERSKLILEAIGYISDAKISARIGEYVMISFTMNADDMRRIDHTVDVPIFNPDPTQ